MSDKPELVCTCGRGTVFHAPFHDPSCPCFTHGSMPPKTRQELRIEELEAALAQAQEEIGKMRFWRASVTASLQREGGALYEDVPRHIKELVAKLAAMEKELHDAKTQCGNNAISHMTQYHRADDLQQQLQTAREQQARLREVILWLLGEKGEFPDRPEKVEGKIQSLYWWRTELRKRFEALQATPTGNAFDARAAVVKDVPGPYISFAEYQAQRERADKLEQVANGVMDLEYWGTHPKTLEALKKLKEQAQQALKE